VARDFDRSDFEARGKARAASTSTTAPPGTRETVKSSGKLAFDVGVARTRGVVADTSSGKPPLEGPALIVADHLRDMGWPSAQVKRLLEGPAGNSIHEIAARPTALAAVNAQPSRASDEQIVVNVKKRCRAAFLKLVPDYLKALILEAQPTPEQLRRFEDYKRQKDILKAAEVIEGAVTAVVTAINPLAGAVVGVAVAGVSATQEVLAKEIDQYVAPWEKKDAGLNGAFALAMMQRRVYSYRGFTSLGFTHATDTQVTFGISLNSPDLARLEDDFDDFIDGLLASAGGTLGIPNLHRYFPVNLVTEKLDFEDRDNERIVRLPDGTRNMAGRIVPQYAVSELEGIKAEVVKAG